MRIRSFVAAMVLTSLGSALASPALLAADNSGVVTPPAPVASVNFDKAIAHAVEQASAVRRVDGIPITRTGQPALQRGYGGGGHMTMVISLVGMVAGIGMTYYMVKQMQKVTTEATQPTQPR
jgi:hypothetical protein